MPTRLIREGIVNSDRVEQLDWPAEVFYRRLLNKVDDYGLYDARPSVLRASLYPLRLDRVREADIQRWIAACEKAGLIVLYEAEGKKYLIVLDTRWKVRSEPKYPLPPPDMMKTIENSCKQLNRSRISQSKSETESDKKKAVFSPPSAPNDNGKPKRPAFEAMLSFIAGLYLEKRGVVLPLAPKDRSSLEMVYDTYTPEVVMAAWEMWFYGGNEDWVEWARKSGHGIPGFTSPSGIGVLTRDKARVAAKAKKYRGILDEKMGKAVPGHAEQQEPDGDTVGAGAEGNRDEG